MPPDHRAIAIDALTRREPGKTLPLCALLEGAARVRCEGTNKRPHLWTGPMRSVAPGPLVGNPVSGRAGGGPAEGAVPDFPPLPRTEALPAPRPCPPDPNHATCLDERARRAAADGDWGGIARACELHTDARWAGECVFQNTEFAMSAAGVNSYPAAASSCLDARVFVPNCETHVVGSLADNLDLSIADATGLIERTWVGDAGTASRVWAMDMFSRRRARALATVAGGAPPTDARIVAQLRMFRAIALVRGGTMGVAGFKELTSALLAAESANAPFLPDQGDAERNSWPADAPGEDAFPAILLEEGSRRTWSTDTTIDARICVLEAIAAQQLGNVSVLEEGLREGNVAVRWTAARLLAAARPTAPALKWVQHDSDPRIAAYAAKLPPG